MDGMSKISQDWDNRQSWRMPMEFVMACLSYSVGLGNFWRFPYLCYRNGGGAFFIPFVIMMITVGIPIFSIELYIGQYTGLSPQKAFYAMSPFFSGLGYCSFIINCIIAVYYMIIVCWILYYLIITIGFDLNWGNCESVHNSEYCYSSKYDAVCRENNTGTSSDLTYFNRQCMNIADICSLAGLKPVNGTVCYNETSEENVPWYSNVTRVMASTEYFDHVLGMEDTSWEQWGEIQWHLVACLFICWLTTYLCIYKSLQNARFVNYFVSLFPYAMLTVLTIQSVTLPGAGHGVWYYIKPKWETLLDVAVWRDAASQVFSSFGIASGSLITLASHNNFYNNFLNDAIIVTFANFITSVYAGFAVFAIIGFLAESMGVPVDYVVGSGPGLLFSIYPEALLLMRTPRLWSILLFFMMFVLGISCQFAAIEAINSSIIDFWPQFQNQHWKVSAFTCIACFILGLPLCFGGGVYLFTLLDWNTSTWGILFIGVMQCVAVAWSYGIDEALCDIASMKIKLSKVTYWYWKLAWSFMAPATGVAVFVFLMFSWTNAYYEDYTFPWAVNLLGTLIGVSTLILFPVGTIWALNHGYRGKALFQPTKLWQPVDKTVLRSDYTVVNADAKL